MNQLRIQIFSTFVLLSIFSCNVIPQAEIDLVHGLFDGTGLKQYLNLSSCEKEFKSFVSSSVVVIQGILSRDQIKLSSGLGQAFIDYSNLIANCKGTKEKLDTLTQIANKIYTDPQQFFLDALDKFVSMHVIADWWGLKGKIKEKNYYELGYALGDMLSYISNFDTYTKNSTSNHKRYMTESIEITKCFDLLLRMKSGFTMIFKTVIEMQLIHLNLEKIIDLVKDLKDFPKVCL